MMKPLARSRRGDIEVFMLGLNVLFIIAIILIFWKVGNAVALAEPDEGIGTRQFAALHTYAISEQMLLYLDVGARIAAQEATGEFARNGAVNVQECGVYATYPSWTSPGESCFPSREEIDEGFKKTFTRVLRSTMRFPGFPGDVSWDISLEPGEALSIKGRTDDEIVLPIIYAPEEFQYKLSSVMLRPGIIALRSGAFAPDTDLGAQVRESGNRITRSEDPTTILITSSRTKTAADALRTYAAGGTSVHYLIDRSGTITQLVPEEQGAVLPCDEDACRHLEQESIVISLVNEGKIGEPRSGTCETGMLARPSQWCESAQFPDGSCGGNAGCWQEYPDLQQESLVRLAADIAGRRDIAPSTGSVMLEEQVWRVQRPGPALAGDDPQAWYGDLLTRILQLSDETGIPSPLPQGSVSLAIASPVDVPVITSCYGERTLEGARDFHDGLDFGVDKEPVRAIADGVVLSVCEGCGGLGNTILIRHAPDLYSRYSHLHKALVGEGETVIRGQQIAISGNTGRSTGPHLDLKIFTSQQAVQESEGGENPLCFFPEDQLKSFRKADGAISCIAQADEEQFSHANPGVREYCEGIDPLGSAPDCFINQFAQGMEGSEILERTIAALNAFPSKSPAGNTLMQEIQQAAAAEDVDPRIIIAIIAQETGGTANPYLVNTGGDVGLGQFSYEGYRDHDSPGEAFGPGGSASCECRSGGICDGRAIEACRGDPRLDPFRSVHAIARHFKAYYDLSFIKEKEHRFSFAIASYNAGPGRVRGAMDELPDAEQRNPSWDELRPHLPAITQEYVPSVLSHYKAQGGDLGLRVRCEGVSGEVREVGSYAFKPGFEIETNDVLSDMRRLVEKIEGVHAACDGSGGDNRDCLGERLADIDSDPFFDVVACEPLRKATALSVHQLVADCLGNRQDGCICNGDLDLQASDVRIRLDGNTPYVAVGGEWQTGERPYWLSRYLESPDAEPEEIPVDILLNHEEGFLQGIFASDEDPLGRHLQIYEVSGDEGDGHDSRFEPQDAIAAPRLSLLKQDGNLAWLREPGETPMCGLYKTQHHVCINITNPIAKDTYATMKFALHLEDKSPPEAVSNIRAVNNGTGLAAAFKPSPSVDVSHYRIYCRPPDYLFHEAESPYTIVLGRTGEDTPITTPVVAALDDCTTSDAFGETPAVFGFEPGSRYTITVVPVDIAGNAGAALETTTNPDDDLEFLGLLGTGNIWTDLLAEYVSDGYLEGQCSQGVLLSWC